MIKLLAALALIVAVSVPLRAEDTLSTARELYAAAAYEDALLVLNRLRAGDRLPDEGRAIEQIRAFCLLALGRADDAEQAIENIVAADPLFNPAGDEVSPRIRTAFSDVRKRMLPAIVQQRYAAAKSAYDAKEFGRAVIGFRQVLDVLSDPMVSAAAGTPPLSDIRTLAAGFHDLSVVAATPPPSPPPSPPPAPAAHVPAGPPPVYGAEDPQVVPPIAIRQSLPPVRIQGAMNRTGVIEVIIDENGAVERAEMRSPLTPGYDRQAVDAAREWKYRPASLNGQPVKYRKVIQIKVEPQR